MKKFKRVVVAVMALAMAATSLVACGKSGNSSTGGNSGKVITLDVYSQRANYQGIQTGWFGTLLKEKFNVEFNIIKETGNTYTTLVEQGDLGDLIIWGATGDNYFDAIDAGLLLDWNQDGILTEYGPYVEQNMAAALAHNADISGGKVYGCASGLATDSSNHDQFFYTWDLRFDIYNEIGCPEIKDLDGLVEVFKQMKEAHPTNENGDETYAVSIWPDWDGSMVMYPKALATAYYGYDELGIGLYNCETGEFYDCLDKEGPYVEMLKFFNTLYREGLLDPSSMTQDYDTATAKVTAGRTFWSIFNYAGNLLYNTDDNLSKGSAMLPVCPTEASPCVYGLGVYGTSTMWSIGSKTEYPDVCMQIINWLSTPEGKIESDYGPQGLMWDYDENGKTYFTELGKKCHMDINTVIESDDDKYQAYVGYTFKEGQQQHNFTTWAGAAINPNSGEGYSCDFWASEQTIPEAGTIEAIWREWATKTTGVNDIITLDDYMEARGEDNYMVSLASTYTEPKKDADFKVLWTQVTDKIVEGSWKAIYATSDAEFEKILQETIEAANSYGDGTGYQQCVDWCKEASALRYAAEEEVRNAEK